MGLYAYMATLVHYVSVNVAGYLNHSTWVEEWRWLVTYLEEWCHTYFTGLCLVLLVVIEKWVTSINRTICVVLTIIIMYWGWFEFPAKLRHQFEASVRRGPKFKPSTHAARAVHVDVDLCMWMWICACGCGPCGCESNLAAPPTPAPAPGFSLKLQLQLQLQLQVLATPHKSKC